VRGGERKEMDIILLWYEALFIALLPVIVRTALTYARLVRVNSVTWFDGIFIFTAALAAFINWMIAGRLLLGGTTGITESDAIGVSLFLFAIGYWVNDMLNQYIHVPKAEVKP
jgi:hypothetical protein